MLTACTLAQGTKWEDCLPYAEFSYNNSFQASLKMSPYEALYGRKCRTPLNWSQTGDSRIFGTDLMLEAEKQVKESETDCNWPNPDRRATMMPNIVRSASNPENTYISKSPL